MTQASIGYGSKFQIGDAASPANFVDLEEVFNITPPSAVADQIEATHMQSPNSRKEFVAGLIDPGEASFEMNYIPGSASDEILQQILDEAPADRARYCRIIFPSGAMHTFIGVLQSYEPTVPTADRMTATVTFKVSGSVTRENSDSPTP